ncbi:MULTISPECIES: hypothetical protein [unclassified Streptomyces]|nr:hypothetical protein [Streptomyces sp. DSM 40167]MDQ0401652.1 hypothetical protein [Streptomyces sp. DSM 40167]
MADAELPDTPLREAYRLATSALPHIAEDHPLSSEIQRAERLLDRFSTL